MELKQIYEFIDDCQEQMFTLWENLVELESESADVDGVNEIARHIDTYCSAMGLNTRKYIFEEAGSSLVAFNKKQKLPGIALLAHMDTVHKKGSFGEKTFSIKEGKAYGPGVYDCKGGIVIAILVMKALQFAGYNGRQVKLVLSGDEEVAHALSKGMGKNVYQEEVNDCCCAFNCESALLSEDIITARKGGGVFQFTVTGVESHAGNEPLRGASAVLEAAKKIIQIHEKSNPDKVLYNCGKVHSENGVNIIAGQCTFDVGIRFQTNDEYHEAVKFLQGIASEALDERTHTEMVENAVFSAMEKTEKTDALFELYATKVEALTGKKIKEVSVGGCSDAAYVSQMNIPVLCGVGAIGAFNHSKEEYALTDSIASQAKKIVATILSLKEDF